MFGHVDGFPNRATAMQFEYAVKNGKPRAVGLRARAARMQSTAAQWAHDKQLPLIWYSGTTGAMAVLPALAIEAPQKSAVAVTEVRPKRGRPRKAG